MSKFTIEALLLVSCLICIELVFYNLKPEAEILSRPSFYVSDRVPQLEESIINWQVRQTLKFEEPQQIIVLGDSSALMGVRTDLLERLIKKSSWNLGTIGWLGVRGHRELLEFFIKHNNIPELVVYYVTLYPLTLSKNELEKFGYYKRFNQWIFPKNTALNWLPSMHFRDLARKLLVSEAQQKFFREVTRGVLPSDEEIHKELVLQHGSLAEPRRMLPTEYRLLNTELDVDVRVELLKLFKLAEDNKFKIYFMLNPLPELLKTEENINALSSLKTELQQLISDDQSVMLAEPFFRFYQNQVFWGETHLLPEIVNWHTEQLADELAGQILNYN